MTRQDETSLTYQNHRDSECARLLVIKRAEKLNWAQLFSLFRFALYQLLKGDKFDSFIYETSLRLFVVVVVLLCC